MPFSNSTGCYSRIYNPLNVWLLSNASADMNCSGRAATAASSGGVKTVLCSHCPSGWINLLYSSEKTGLSDLSDSNKLTVQD